MFRYNKFQKQQSNGQNGNKRNKNSPTPLNIKKAVLNDPILFDKPKNNENVVASQKKEMIIFDRDLTAKKNVSQAQLLPIIKKPIIIQQNKSIIKNQKHNSDDEQNSKSNSSSYKQEEEKNTYKFTKMQNNKMNQKIISNKNYDDRSSSQDFELQSSEINSSVVDNESQNDQSQLNQQSSQNNLLENTKSNKKTDSQSQQLIKGEEDYDSDEQEQYEDEEYNSQEQQEEDTNQNNENSDYSEEGEMDQDQSQNQQNSDQSEQQNDEEDIDDDADDEDFSDQFDQGIEDRVEMKRKPILSEAALRTLNFQLRRIDPSIARGAVQRTQRDESGKRITPQQIKKEELSLKIIKNIPNEESKLAQLRKNLIQKRQEQQQIQQQQQQQFFQQQDIYQSPSQQLSYNCEQKWKNFLFTDEMCTPQNVENARRLKLFDSTFEVNQDFQLDTNLIVKPFERSNQGKQETVWRSDSGMIKSLKRLHDIFCDRKKRKDNGNYVSIVDIFQYISDRFRALNTELIQIESQNRSNIWNSQVKQFSCQIVRIYLLSYLEMMQADQVTDEIKQNKKNCQQYLIEAMDVLILDYSKLFHELNEERYYLLDNLPEFIQYYHLMLTLSILNMESIQKLSKLDYIIYREFPFAEKLMNTKEYRFCKNIQEYMIIRNFKVILDLINEQDITIFQLFFVYLFQEKINDYVNSDQFKGNFYDQKKGLSLDYFDISLISQKITSMQKVLELINFRGNFSKIILGLVQNQPIQQVPQIIKPYPIQKIQPQKNYKNILIEIGRKLILNEITNFITPHFEKVEEELGNFYKKLRIMKHWKLYVMKRKRTRKFKQLCNKNSNPLKQVKLADPVNFRVDLCKKLISQFPNKSQLYYKIVILNNNSNTNLLNRLLFTLCDNNFSQQDDSILVEMSFNNYLGEFKFTLSIQILETLQVERICGTDIYIFLKNQNYPGKPTLLIDTQNQKDNDQLIYLNYEYIELFDNFYDSYEFKQKISLLIDESLKNKKEIQDLQLLSLSDLFIKINEIDIQNYNPLTSEFLIAKCTTAEMFLEKILQENHHSDDLPQELLFDKYINQDMVLRYAAKFNPGNKLMISLCSKLQKEFVSENDIINEIKSFLEDYVDEEALLNLLQKHFKFGKTCSGNWQILIEFIFEQLVQYLKDSQIYFIVNSGRKFSIDEETLQKRIQKDIHELLKPKLNQKSQTMSRIFKPYLEELIQKKICK